MIKVVFNDSLNPYGLSKAAYDYMGLDWDREVIWPLERAVPGITKRIIPAGMAFINDRSNPKLVRCVEELGREAGIYDNYLMILQLPDGTKLKITQTMLGGDEIIYLL